ncbi:MAG: MBL fold metallo-hydrolase [Oscillospiraceae bacterium]|nr:MBL fold metallo-hydrolase [Oscillospiraceae bacterium]
MGTSAGEEYPGAWCVCENCEKARKWGGRNIRRNSGVILDGDVMIDMGKTAHIQAEKFNINLRGIKFLLSTHSHWDHLNTHTLWSRIAAFGPGEMPELNIFGSSRVADVLAESDRMNPESLKIKINMIEPFKKYYAGDLEFFTLDGNHSDGGGVRSVNYIITRKNKTFAYLSDTGYPFDETLKALTKYKYDFIIAECTFLYGEDNPAHMGINQNIRLLGFFGANNLWKNKPEYYLTHISPHWCPPHDEYEPLVKSKGMKLAYDGLVIEY